MPNGYEAARQIALGIIVRGSYVSPGTMATGRLALVLPAVARPRARWAWRCPVQAVAPLLALAAVAGDATVNAARATRTETVVASFLAITFPFDPLRTPPCDRHLESVELRSPPTVVM
jgi:hypothetical protein